MTRIHVLSYKVNKRLLYRLKVSLNSLLYSSNLENLTGAILWRFNYNSGDSDSKVCVVAYNSGSVVVSGHGQKFDLTSRLVKSYDEVTSKK